MKRLRDAVATSTRVFRRSVALQAAGRFVLVVLLAYGTLRFIERLYDGPGLPAAVAHPVPPPGARDSLNAAIWIPG